MLDIMAIEEYICLRKANHEKLREANIRVRSPDAIGKVIDGLPEGKELQA